MKTNPSFFAYGGHAFLNFLVFSRIFIQGIDSGGLTKEWYMLLSRDYFASEHCLFEYHDTGVYGINPRSTVNEEAQNYFSFFGVLMAKAIFDKRLVDVNLCTMLFRHILGTRHFIVFFCCFVLPWFFVVREVFNLCARVSLLQASALFWMISGSWTKPCIRACSGF